MFQCPQFIVIILPPPAVITCVHFMTERLLDSPIVTFRMLFFPGWSSPLVTVTLLSPVAFSSVCLIVCSDTKKFDFLALKKSQLCFGPCTMNVVESSRILSPLTFYSQSFKILLCYLLFFKASSFQQ